jgi:hypothetical protein
MRSEEFLEPPRASTPSIVTMIVIVTVTMIGAVRVVERVPVVAAHIPIPAAAVVTIAPKVRDASHRRSRPLWWLALQKRSEPAKTPASGLEPRDDGYSRQRSRLEVWMDSSIAIPTSTRVVTSLSPSSPA